MSERLSWQKKTKRSKGASFEALRAAGAARAAATAERVEDERTRQLAEIARERWEHAASQRSANLTVKEFAHVGEALQHFTTLMGEKPALAAAAEASAALGDDERAVFYDDLARENILPLDTVLAMRPSSTDEHAAKSEPETELSPYEKKRTELREKFGEPESEVYGSVVWKQKDGSAALLEKDGTLWTVKRGDPHRFGTHGRVVTLYWDSKKGFVELEPIIEEMHREALAGDFTEAFDRAEKQPIVLKPIRNVREQRRADVRSTHNEDAAAVNLGKTLDELTAKLGAHQRIGRIPYWKRADGTAIVFDSPSADAPAIPLVVRENGTHRFQGAFKRWTGNEFVDA